MTDTTPRDEIAAHLFERLAACAEDIRRGGAMDDHALASVFMSIGLTLARHAHGAVQAAEWARDCADTIEQAAFEADEFSLNGRLQ